MGRAGIEPATHGFSEHCPISRKYLNSSALSFQYSDGAVLALQIDRELTLLRNIFRQMSDLDRAAFIEKITRTERLRCLPEREKKDTSASVRQKGQIPRARSSNFRFYSS
jgi:hypothetical protein